MDDNNAIVITGAFGYTGKYATRLLLQRGHQIRTLTNQENRDNLFGGQVRAYSYTFDQPGELQRAMDGASVLINTYWVRFPRGKATFEKAVENTLIMLRAAEKAGVKRIVHVSIANPSPSSPLGYYKAKAALEQAIRASRLSYNILRPTVIFGREDILINNIAWFVRHFPFFGMPGDGEYKVQPIYVGDLAELIVSAAESDANYILDAVGPEIFTFDQLVTMIANAMNRSTRIVHLPVWLCYVATSLLGWGLRDVVLTWEEYKGLIGNLLISDADPPGRTRLSQWLVENREMLGVHYASEVARHFR